MKTKWCIKKQNKTKSNFWSKESAIKTIPFPGISSCPNVSFALVEWFIRLLLFVVICCCCWWFFFSLHEQLNTSWITTVREWTIGNNWTTIEWLHYVGLSSNRRNHAMQIYKWIQYWKITSKKFATVEDKKKMCFVNPLQCNKRVGQGRADLHPWRFWRQMFENNKKIDKKKRRQKKKNIKFCYFVFGFCPKWHCCMITTK